MTSNAKEKSRPYTITLADASGSKQEFGFGVGHITVGTASSNDITIPDKNGQDGHLNIELPGRPDEGIRLRPEGRSIEIIGFGKLHPNQFADVVSGTEIKWDNSVIVVSKTSAVSIPDRWLSRSLAAACIVLLALLSWNWYARLNPAPPEEESASLDRQDSALTAPDSSSKNTTNAFDPERLEAFAWTVRTQLEDLGIGEGLTVVSTVEGRLEITGILPNRDRSTWQEFLRWYASRTNYPPLTHNINQEITRGDVPELNSIWLDEEPSVVFRNGSIGRVGSEIKGGWVVISISRNAVVLARDGSHITLKF